MGSYPSWIAGVQHRSEDERAVASSLVPGALLDLEQDEDNAFDPDAVKIIYQDVHIGYVPDRHNYISRILDEGGEIACYFCGLDDDGQYRIRVLTGPDVDELKLKISDDGFLILPTKGRNIRSKMIDYLKITVLLLLAILLGTLSVATVFPLWEQGKSLPFHGLEDHQAPAELENGSDSPVILRHAPVPLPRPSDF